MDAKEIRVSGYIKGFFEVYSLEAIVKKFYWYLIQSPSNKKGVPFNVLLEAAHDGVFEAARRYDPDFSQRTGRVASQFNSFAIGTLKFNIHNAARQQTRDAKLTPVHLEDRVRGDKEDTEMGSLLTVADESGRNDDNPEVDAVLAGMQALSPVARRIVQLRFALDTNLLDPDDPTLEEIAQVIFDETLTVTRVSRERVRQILEKSLTQLRRASFSGTLPEWQGFFADIHAHEAPRPLLIEPGEAGIFFAPEMELQVQPEERRNAIVLDITQIHQNPGREYDILVRSRDEETLEDLGIYEITVLRGKIISCERID
jgi:hypothetical protein